jgi:hypothetical protein
MKTSPREKQCIEGVLTQVSVIKSEKHSYKKPNILVSWYSILPVIFRLDCGEIWLILSDLWRDYFLTRAWHRGN